MRVLPALASLLVAGSAFLGARADDATRQEAERLARENEILKRHVDLSRGDAFYMVLDPNAMRLKLFLRGAVLTIVGRGADDAVYEKLHSLGKAEISTEQKRMLYSALAASANPAHAKQTLAIALTNELVPRGATQLVNEVAGVGEHPAMMWDFAKANLETLKTKLGPLQANEYIPELFRHFADAKRADELETFAKTSLPPESAPAVARTADEVRHRAELRDRVLPEVEKWCRSRMPNSQ